MNEKINSGLAGYIPPISVPPPGQTFNVPVPVPKVPVLVSEWTPDRIAKLARELAVNIRAPKDILADFGCSEEQFNAYIKPNPLFANALQHLIAEWNDAGNAPKRLRLQAQAILEDTMPELAGRMSNPRSELKDVVSAFQAVSKIAGMSEGSAPAAAGEKFTITINLGSDTLHYDKITGSPKGTIEPIEDKPDERT